MADCERCKGSGIDPEHSFPGSYGGWSWEPPALGPCIACQYENLPKDGPCHCGAVLLPECSPAACGWQGPESCVWDHGQDECFGQ